MFVIFGATGDLTKRLLIPSLYNLLANKLLPDKFAIIGVSNVKMSSEDFRKQLGDEIGQFTTTKVKPELWKWFDQRISYMSGDFKDPATYQRAQDRARADRQAARHAGKLSVLYRGVAKFLRRDRKATGRAPDSPKKPMVIGEE